MTLLKILLSAGLFALSFPSDISLNGFPFLSWVFLIPLFFVLEGQKFLFRFGAGFAFGILAYAFSLTWMIPYSFPGYLLLVAALSVQPAVFAALRYPIKSNIIFSIMFTASLWVVTEHARRWFMFGQSWDLAHCQVADAALFQVSYFLGSSAVSFLLIAGNVCFYEALRRKVEGFNRLKRMDGLVFMAVLIGLVYTYGLIRIAPGSEAAVSSIKVGLLHSHHSYNHFMTEQEARMIALKNFELTRTSIEREDPDLVIWPETALAMDFRKDPELSARLRSLKIPLLMGSVFEEGGLRNSAVLLDAEGNIAEVYYKRHLIPLTEYIPDTWFWRSWSGIFGDRSQGLHPGRGDRPGIMAIRVRDGRVIRLGVAICSEDNIAEVFRDYRRRGADFFVVLLNNGWFEKSSGAVMHAQHSRVRAFENRGAVLRSANAGVSGVMDPLGGTKVILPNRTSQHEFFFFQVPVYSDKGFLNLSHMFFMFCFLFVILGLLKKNGEKYET